MTLPELPSPVDMSQSFLHFSVALIITVFSISLTAPYSRSQDSTEVVVPDGTQGETMTVGKSDSVLTSNNWYEFDSRHSSLRIGGGVLYDWVTYIQDEESRKQISLFPKIQLRDFRIFMSGKIKTKRFLTWKFGIMYDASVSSWLARETGIMIGVPEVAGNVFIGRTKEGFSLNKVMTGYLGWTMERQMALDVIPILADGIKYMGFLPDQRIFWNAGAYVDWLTEKQSFATYEKQFVLRFGVLPVFSEESKSLLHIGVNYRYGIPDNKKIRVRSRPESNPSPYFLDTDVFPADHSSHLGWEVYFSSGGLMIGSEGYFTKFSSPEKDNPLFKGGDAVISYFLTGESRPYSTVSGVYSAVKAKKPVFSGGPGAIEFILRYSILNLNDAGITGGQFWRITPMVNWYMSDFLRLELAYGYGVLDRFGLRGTTQFFQSRIQIAVL